MQARMAMVGKVASIAGAIVLAAMTAGRPEAATDPCGDFVSVGPGDTLGAIARRCEMSIPGILLANPDIDDPNRLEIGQIVRLRPPAMRSSEAGYRREDVDWSRAMAEGYYRVRSGDTFDSIAEQSGIPLSLLTELNPDIVPDTLPPGLIITLPQAETRSASAGGTSLVAGAAATGRIE